MNIKTLIGHFLMSSMVLAHFWVFSEDFMGLFSDANYQFAGTAMESDLDDGTLAIANTKMNVFYIGIENPVTVAVSNVRPEDLSLSSGDPSIGIVRKGIGNYNVTVNSVGATSLMVTNTKTGKSKVLPFRVQRIPDPVVKIGKKTNGLLSSGEFRAQPGLSAYIENVDMDARCQIESYTLYYVCKRCDAIELKGDGGRFTGQILNAVRQARPGDQYAFTNVRARCPGDQIARKLNGLSFKIK